MENNKINITKEQFEKIIKNKVGQGTDGLVFNFNNDYLIKIYRKSFFNNPSELVEDDSDMKIYDPKNKPKFASSKPNIRYYIKDVDDSNIRLRDQDAINEIANKQKDVNLTKLPEKAVYVDGKLVGVLLKKVKFLEGNIPIHDLRGAPFLYKKKLALETIKAVKELMDNNIYHEDLSNSPDVQTHYYQGGERHETKGHSHVLVNPITQKVNIIDLDGKSTVYRDEEDKYHEKNTLEGLKTLLLEFLYEIDANKTNDLEEESIDVGHYISEEMCNELVKKGINRKTAERIIYQGFNSIEDAENIVRQSK